MHHFHDIDFVRPAFAGEDAEARQQKRVGAYDLRPFAQAIRVYKVQVGGRLLANSSALSREPSRLQFIDNHVRPSSAAVDSRPPSVSHSQHEQSTLASEMATFCVPLAQSSMRASARQNENYDNNFNVFAVNDAADETIRPRNHVVRGSRLL